MTNKNAVRDYLNEMVREMKGLESDGDYEAAHSRADGILCDVLEQLGYKRLVDAWDRVGKWYA